MSAPPPTSSPAARQAFAGPVKPHTPEADVLHFVAPGQTESPEQILRRQLSRRGLKYTTERREILKAVLSTHEHFDADTLYKRVRKTDARVSKATVYRTLGLLCDCHLMREVFQDARGAHYEHTYGHEHHEHMICQQCGQVIEFVSRELEKLQDEACRAHGFHAVRHHLQVFGFCATCHPCGAQFPPHSAQKKPNPAAASAVRGGDELQQVAPGETHSPEGILRRRLARRGLKFTNERRDILRTVMSTHQHFDAEWLCSKLKETTARASKATVYRTLALLCECHLIREVFHGQTGARYEHTYGHEHHEHMICLTCDTVIEFISRRLEELQEQACRAHGFHAVRHHLQVFGYCATCHPCKAFFPPSKA